MQNFHYKIPIVWLDTNVLIEIARAKSGLKQDGPQKQRALSIFDLVYKLVRNGKILCIEGEQKNEYGINPKLADKYDKVITNLTLGIKLRPARETKQFQLYKMMQFFLRKKNDFILEKEDIFYQDPIQEIKEIDKTGFIVSVNSKISENEISEKLDIRDTLFNECERIRLDNKKIKKNYKSQLKDELAAECAVIKRQFIVFKTQINDKTLNIDNLLQASDILEPIVFWQRISGRVGDLGGLQKFYLSNEYRQIPNIEIFSRLYAALLTDPIRKIHLGDYMDIKQASIALPYCDYIITDGNQKDRIIKARLETKYNVKVFSLKETGNFIKELNHL